jgi:hypothetical protein
MRTLLALALAVFALTACKKEEARPAEPPKPVEAKPAEPAARPAEAAAAPAAEDGGATAGGKRITLEVTGDGFVPSNVTLKANEPVVLVVTRKTDETCATDLLVEGTDIKQRLPLNTAVEIAWTPTKAGKVKFGCAMDMMIGGVLVVE